MILDKTLYVMPGEKYSIQGRGKYSLQFNNGTRINVGRQRANGVKIPYGFTKDNNNRLVTGMGENIDNPYYEIDLKTLPGHLTVGSKWVRNYDNIKSQPKIKLQTLLEIIDNVDPDYYTSVSGRLTMFQLGQDVNLAKEQKTVYLDTFSIFLEERTNIFPGKTTRGRLGILICENHPRIAPDKESYNEDEHDFYIGEADEAVKEQNKAIDKVMTGFMAYGKLTESYDHFTAYQIATILELVRGDANPSVVENH